MVVCARRCAMWSVHLCLDLQVRDFFQKVDLAPIDTYFMIDCVNGGKVPGPPVDPSDLGAALPTSAGVALPAAAQIQLPT